MDEKRLEIWLKLGQFVIGSVVLGIATTVVNYHIQQREIEIKELEQLGKFVEQAIDENVAVRQRFADYFATVSRSEIARERWLIYKTKLDKEQAEIEAVKDALKKEKEAQAAKAEEANKALQDALQQVAELSKKLTGLADAQPREDLQRELEAKRGALEIAQVQQLEADQQIATLEVRLEETAQQLQYPVKTAPAVASKIGWVFLGTYDDDSKVWSNSYFSVGANMSPDELKGTRLVVSTTAVNVRSGMPNAFGRNAPIIDALKQGATVSVLEVMPWSLTGYIWARVNY